MVAGGAAFEGAAANAPVKEPAEGRLANAEYRGYFQVGKKFLSMQGRWPEHGACQLRAAANGRAVITCAPRMYAGAAKSTPVRPAAAEIKAHKQ